MNQRILCLSVLLLSTAAAGCGNATDDRDPTWGYISPVLIQPNCATSSCHSKGAAVAGLDLSTIDDGYTSLLKLHVDKPVPNVPRPLVVPGNPDESRLMNMLRANGARRMPPDRPMAGADVELIGQWILNGAQNN